MSPDVRRLSLSSLLLGFVGTEIPAWLSDALADGLGGVVLFGSNLGDGTRVGRLTAQLRAAAGRDIVIALDEEGGDVTRLDTVRGSASPGAAALGRLDDPDATEAVYRGIGARCAEAGVTTDLAPVADVNIDPLNPVIGLRAFSDDPRVAARHVAAAVRGLQSVGVAACAKHFPGHGATRNDSHHEIARLDRSIDQLRDVEFVPFRAAIEAGARAVMTGHLVAPALDAERLATISPAVTTDALRGELGFTGTVMTDALEMKALSGTLGMVEGFVQALIAGADAIESGALDYPELVTEIPAAVQRAIDEGRLDPARLEDAAARTARLASPARASAVDDVSDDAADIAARSIEVLGSLPVLSRPVVLEARPPGGMATGVLPWSLGAELAALVPGTELIQVEPPGDDAGLQFLAPRGCTLVVVVKDPELHPWQRKLLELARTRPGSVVVDVGWPADVGDLPVVRTRGIAPGLLKAAAQRLAEHVDTPAGVGR